MHHTPNVVKAQRRKKLIKANAENAIITNSPSWHFSPAYTQEHLNSINHT